MGRAGTRWMHVFKKSPAAAQAGEKESGQEWRQGSKQAEEFGGMDRGWLTEYKEVRGLRKYDEQS